MNAIQKMICSGTNALSNAELLSVAIGTDTDTAEKVFRYAEEINTDIGSMEVRELMQIDGIGEAKASKIVAATELSKRFVSAKAVQINTRVRDSKQVADMLMEDVFAERVEKFIVLLLDTRLRIKGKRTIAMGGLDSCPVHPREVFSPAVRNGSAAVIVAHNHPSGDPTPSAEDIAITKRLLDASEVLGIKLVDHVIVGNNAFVSMKAEGYFNK